MKCQEARALLALAESGLQPPEDTARYGAHLDDCRRCRGERSRLREVYQSYASALKPPNESERAALWEGIAARLHEKPAGIPAKVKEQASPVSVTLALSCAYCHGALARNEAAYCASCLSAHHADCFRGHGRCSIFGCEEAATVRPRLVDQAPKRRSLAWIRGAGVAALTLVGLGSAAYTGMLYSEIERLRDLPSLEAQKHKNERARLDRYLLESEREDLRKIIQDMAEAPARARSLELAALESRAQRRDSERSLQVDLAGLGEAYDKGPREERLRILASFLELGNEAWRAMPILRKAIASSDPELVLLGLEGMIPTGKAAALSAPDFGRLVQSPPGSASADQKQEIRIAAMRALVAVGDQALVESEALMAAAGDEDVVVREAAYRAIGDILKRRQQSGSDWARVERALRFALRDKELYQVYPNIPRRWALAYLANVIPGRIEVTEAAAEILDAAPKIDGVFKGATPLVILNALVTPEDEAELAAPLAWRQIDERVVIGTRAEVGGLRAGKRYGGRHEEDWEESLAGVLKLGCEDPVSHLRALARSYLRSSGRLNK